MQKCSKCNRLYSVDESICQDCQADLEEFDASQLVLFKEVDKKPLAHKFVNFLHYSQVMGAYQYDEENEVWKILVKESDLKQTKKLYDAFYTVEKEKALNNASNINIEHTVENDEDMEITKSSIEENNIMEDDFSEEDTDEITESEIKEDKIEENDLTVQSHSSISEEMVEEDTLFDQDELKDIGKGNKVKPEKSQTYVKKEEQYKDLISSAYSFLIISILGLLVLGINAAGIINLFDSTITYLVMGGLFLVFLYIGITTFIKAKKVKAQIPEENQVTEAINNFLSQSVTKESLEELVNPADSQEIQFMQKLEKMKELITSKFGELDDLYLDRIVEEYYNSHFE